MKRTILSILTGLSLTLSSQADPEIIPLPYSDVQTLRQDYPEFFHADKAKLFEWMNKLNMAPAILLDITSKPIAHIGDDIAGMGRCVVYLEVVYAIDKGYGYSVGPFRGAILLLPTGGGHFKWWCLQDINKPIIYSHYASTWR